MTVTNDNYNDPGSKWVKFQHKIVTKTMTMTVTKTMTMSMTMTFALSPFYCSLSDSQLTKPE